MEKSVVHL